MITSVLTFKPMSEENYINELSGQVNEGYSTNSLSHIDDNIDSSKIFGRDDKSNSIHALASTDNLRGYIVLDKPIMNFVLSRAIDTSVLRRILGIKKDIYNGIMKFTMVYDKTLKGNSIEDHLVQVTQLSPDADIDDILIGPEIILEYINKFDTEAAIEQELLSMVAKTCFTDAALKKGFGDINTDGIGQELVGGYYIDVYDDEHLKDGITVEMISDEIYTKCLTGGESRIHFLFNTSKARMRGCILTMLSVMPKSLRPVIKNMHDPIDVAYTAIIQANNSLSNMLSGGAVNVAEVINGYKNLHNKVNQLTYKSSSYDRNSFSILEKLNGKKGHIRNHMLSKRSDYSGRSVVVSNPKLKLTQIGLPDEIVYKLFRHFHVLSKKGDLTAIDAISSMSPKEACDEIYAIKVSDMPREWQNEFIKNPDPLQCTQDNSLLINNLIVIMNRAPTLHRLSMLGYHVVRSRSKAIEVNCLVNEGFNMDFDGDTTALQLPITLAGQIEARTLLYTAHNLYKPSDGKCTLMPRLDMIYGLSVLTSSSYKLYKPVAVLDNGQQLWDSILSQKIKVHETVTVNKAPYMKDGIPAIGSVTDIAGYLLIRMILPSELCGYKTEITKKTIGNYVNELLKRDKKTFLETLFTLTSVGFKIAKIYPPVTSVITRLDKNAFRKPFDEFHKNIEELQNLYEAGFETEEDYNAFFDEQLDKVNDSVKESVFSNLEGVKITECVEMLYGLHMATLNKYRLDNVTPDEFLLSISSKEELERMVLDKLIKVNETILFNGKRHIAGKCLVGIVAGKNVIMQIDETNIGSYDGNSDIVDLGFKLAKLYSLNAIPDSLFSYNNESISRENSRTIRVKNGFIELVKCGARGDDSNLIQMYVFKGRIAKATGEAFNAIIENSFASQLTSLEHFISAYGSRKGVLDKSVKPADTGYAERLMWHTTEDIIITEEDCGTNEGFEINIDDLVEHSGSFDPLNKKYDDAKEVIKKIIVGRYEVGSNKKMITPEMADKIATRMREGTKRSEKTIIIRSPIKCKNPCCARCYGIDLTLDGPATPGTAVGIIAAQSIGEPGTQLTMKSLQKGGVAGRGDVGSEFDKINNLIKTVDTTKNPIKYPLYDPIAWADGKVIIQTDSRNPKNNKIMIEGSKASKSIDKSVEIVEVATKGQGLCKLRGNYDLKEKAVYSGTTEAQKYLIYSCFYTYLNVTSVNIKHFEILATAMTMKLVISTNNHKLKVCQLYTKAEYMSKSDGVNDRALDVLVSVKNVPIVKESALSNIFLENFSTGISRAMLLGNKETFTSPFNAVAFGFRPQIGTQIPNYISNRLKNERCKF